MKSFDSYPDSLPRCCGRDMGVMADNGRFWETYCDVCKDVVYVRKPRVSRHGMGG